MRSSLLCDLKTLTILLNECRHKVWIKINNNMKLPDIIKGLKYALSFLYIDINATSDDPNQCNLDINNITSHMYEHIL